MAIRPHLPLDERLSILRASDNLRPWQSLDDKRVCILCQKTFTGRQVEIVRGRTGAFHLHCPTERCNSGPSQWVFPGNPLISETAYHDWQRTFDAHNDADAASVAA